MAVGVGHGEGAEHAPEEFGTALVIIQGTHVEVYPYGTDSPYNKELAVPGDYELTFA